MKILLTTLNSKYVHANLALKYLYTVVAGEYSDVEAREFTINNDPHYVYGEILRGGYDMVCFSCYIWNISRILELIRDLKKARPQVRIVVGGPEVTFEAPVPHSREKTHGSILCCAEKASIRFTGCVRCCMSRSGRWKRFRA